MCSVPFRSALWMLLACLLSTAAARAAAPVRYYRGTLDDRLQVDAAQWSTWTWHPAIAAEVERLGLTPADIQTAYAGECLLPDEPQHPIAGRLVTLRDGTRIAWLDLNRDGAFTADERATLVRDAGNVGTWTAQFSHALAHGAYTQLPVLLRVHAEAAGPTQTVLIAASPVVEGHIQLPSGPVLMRFSYDAAQGRIDVAHAAEWMDVNRDGRIEDLPASPERGYTHDAAPIFRIGDLYLQATRFAPETRTFTMRTVPADSYHRVEMAVGDKLPDFAFRDAAGHKGKLSDLKGDERLLFFWTSQCRACLDELPILKAAYDRYYERGLEILSLSGDPDPHHAAEVLQQAGAEWPQAQMDQQMLEQRFQISTWPTMVLIDRGGKVVSISQPPYALEGKALDKTLAALLP